MVYLLGLDRHIDGVVVAGGVDLYRFLGIAPSNLRLDVFPTPLPIQDDADAFLVTRLTL